MERPNKRNDKRKNKMNCSRLKNRAERLMVSNTYVLVNIVGNQSCFVSRHSAIGFVFNPTNPLTTNQVYVGWDGTNSHVLLAIRAL